MKKLTLLLIIILFCSCHATLYEGSDTFCTHGYEAKSVTFIKSLEGLKITDVEEKNSYQTDVYVQNHCGQYDDIPQPYAWLKWVLDDITYSLATRLMQGGDSEFKCLNDDNSEMVCPVHFDMHDDYGYQYVEIKEAKVVKIQDGKYDVSLVFYSDEDKAYKLTAVIELVETPLVIEYEPMECSYSCSGNIIPESMRDCEASCDNGISASCQMNGEEIIADVNTYCGVTDQNNCNIKRVEVDPSCVGSFDVSSISPTPNAHGL